LRIDNSNNNSKNSSSHKVETEEEEGERRRLRRRRAIGLDEETDKQNRERIQKILKEATDKGLTQDQAFRELADHVSEESRIATAYRDTFFDNVFPNLSRGEQLKVLQKLEDMTIYFSGEVDRLKKRVEENKRKKRKRTKRKKELT
jgi:hypothetical protein